MNPELEETIHVDFITSSPTTGAAANADSTPTVEVFEDATETAILSPTVTQPQWQDRGQIKRLSNFPLSCHLIFPPWR